MKKNNIIFLIVILTIFFIEGCADWKGTEKEAVDIVLNEIKLKSDSISQNLVIGIKKGLNGDTSAQSLAHLIDSVITHAGTSANTQIRNIRDSLLDSYFQNTLKSMEDTISVFIHDSLLGNRTQSELQQIRNSILDKKLKNYLDSVFASIIPNILNDANTNRIIGLKDSLIGDRTKNQLLGIISSVSDSLSASLNTKFNPVIKSDVTFFERNALTFIIIVGIICLVIIWFVWRQKEKYLKLTKMLTYQVSEFRDNDSKEDVKNKISKQAQTVGLEDELRKLLDKQGLLHADSKQKVS